MSQFRNSPAIQKILRALGNGESLSGAQIRSRTGSDVNKDQRAKLTDAGFVGVDSAGRGFIYTLTADGLSFVRDELGGPLEAPEADSSRLSGKERIALFALLSPSLEVAGADIKRLFGVTISKPVRTSLSDRGLVVVFERPIRFELTEKGWQVVEEELAKPGEPDDPPLLRMFHHQYSRALSALRSRGLGLVELYAEGLVDEPAVDDVPKTVGARVIESYEDLTSEPGGWVSLVKLRDHLADVERDELDEVLSALFRDGRIRLISEVNQRMLTDTDREAALAFGGDHKHLYQVG
ncbi:hypothetical protein FB566_4951 [Stackebrandtia endophytica]|uniref:Uncharacterized protein n=1 Tax=Stackebrandtia endophytica TaxID=1496996 RepID=A0A543B3K9_9ACTN|nr:hypothetical protein [Stackebrandtia endophytica]TQL79350.1 hypothetical protein FB566_4951 [Stackebrandtia endophytica]